MCHRIPRALAAALLLGALAATTGCRALPPPREQPVPRLRLGQDTRSMTLRAYGMPHIASPTHLWYVGPEPDSLADGTNGWMTLLTYDIDGKLICQEFLTRGPEQGYNQVHYWVKGRLNVRDRDNDLDRRMLPRAVDLARKNSNYRVTWNETDRFVLARLLPAANEPVVTWSSEVAGDRSEVRLDMKTLTGRDEPLIERVNGAITQRMLLIEATLEQSGSLLKREETTGP